MKGAHRDLGSGRRTGTGANADIVSFLNTNKGSANLPQAHKTSVGGPAFGRQDTGFSRASGDISDRNSGYDRKTRAPTGASDYGDLGIPT